MTAAVAQAGSEETILRWSPYVGFTFGALTFLNHLAPAISEPGTDGTFPLFREIVHPELKLFFEVQLLT
jgi:hypothetical protein